MFAFTDSPLLLAWRGCGIEQGTVGYQMDRSRVPTEAEPFYLEGYNWAARFYGHPPLDVS